MGSSSRSSSMSPAPRSRSRRLTTRPRATRSKLSAPIRKQTPRCRRESIAALNLLQPHRRGRAERVIVEHLWSQADATSGNRWQMREARKRLKQANPQPSAAPGNRSRPHGKEGVNGSSPLEGSCESPAKRAFLPRRTGSQTVSDHQWSVFWNTQVVPARHRATDLAPLALLVLALSLVAPPVNQLLRFCCPHG
jgi:hypothetical protein